MGVVVKLVTEETKNALNLIVTKKKLEENPVLYIIVPVSTLQST